MTKLVERIKSCTDSLVFKEVMCFKLQEKDLLELTESLETEYKEKKGIYFFQIENDLKSKNFDEWYKDFEKRWVCCNNKITHTSKTVAPRIKSHKGNKIDWIPLYIGKAENLSKRVKEHLSNGAASTTYALKLKERKSCLKDYNFKLSVIDIDVENYDQIVPIIENTLRDKYKPIIGKQ